MDNIECSIVGSERSWFLEGGKDRVGERVCTISQNIFTFAEKFLWHCAGDKHLGCEGLCTGLSRTSVEEPIYELITNDSSGSFSTMWK